jgi:hypothetical protein
MLEYDEKASKSDLYSRVKSVPLNEIQRGIAISALRHADVVSDRIMWVVNGIRRLAGHAGARPGQLTHNH